MKRVIRFAVFALTFAFVFATVPAVPTAHAYDWSKKTRKERVPLPKEKAAPALKKARKAAPQKPKAAPPKKAPEPPAEEAGANPDEIVLSGCKWGNWESRKTYLLDQDLVVPPEGIGPEGVCIGFDGSGDKIKNVTLDCQNHSIAPHPDFPGLKISDAVRAVGQLENVTVKNCVIGMAENGFHLFGLSEAGGLVLQNNTVRKSDNGFFLEGIAASEGEENNVQPRVRLIGNRSCGGDIDLFLVNPENTLREDVLKAIKGNENRFDKFTNYNGRWLLEDALYNNCD